MIHQAARAAKTLVDNFIFIDAKAPYEGLIVDPAADRLLVLVYGKGVAIETSAAGFAIPGITLTPDMRFQRGGTNAIAELPCTDWDIAPGNIGAAQSSAAKQEPWTVCITTDGVVLRASSAMREMEAISVKYGPLPADRFVPPAELKLMKAAPK